MTTKKLIEIADDCYNGICGEECPFYNSNECREDFIRQLADKLEMALADVPHNCGTCLHAGKKLRDVPCSVCLIDAYRKEWQWKGDAE